MRSIKPLMRAAIIFAIPLGLSIQSFQSCSSGYLPLSGPDQEARNEDSEPPTPTLPPPNDKSFYYPPVSNSEKEACDSSTWEYTSSLSAGFNEEKLNEVMNFIKEPSQHTTAFVILHRGRIVREWYSGKIDLSDYNSGLTQGLLRVANWDCNSADRIHSASKSMISVAIGIAEQERRLKLEDPVSQFLGGWTNLSSVDEDKIRVKHLLTMTSGLDGAPAGGDGFETPEGKIKGILINDKYQAPENAWFYNTTAYHRLFAVIDRVGQGRDQFFKGKIFDRIGMSDSQVLTENIISSGRDMARFGLLMLGNGNWKDDSVVNSEFVRKATSPFLSLPVFSGTSLERMNRSYGFLFWLNGQSSWMSGACFDNLGLLKPTAKCRAANDSGSFNGSLIKSAPADLIAALGLGDKKIYIVPSLDLVIARHGTPPAGDETQYSESKLDVTLWEKLMEARQ